MKVGDKTTFLGMPAVVTKIKGNMVTYTLGTEKVEVTIDTTPREKVGRSRSSGT